MTPPDSDASDFEVEVRIALANLQRSVDEMKPQVKVLWEWRIGMTVAIAVISVIGAWLANSTSLLTKALTAIAGGV